MSYIIIVIVCSIFSFWIGAQVGANYITKRIDEINKELENKYKKSDTH